MCRSPDWSATHASPCTVTCLFNSGNIPMNPNSSSETDNCAEQARRSDGPLKQQQNQFAKVNEVPFSKMQRNLRRR
ncbi:hypothetical protein M513_04140 [Trichuris suis]|uniref:Uncharacterized protein n=1 Tax=Trichuris suis TaxID=68888 RepID=A0A085MCL2_9BILA|nr:hypothetical protein M513_04140 [Trichuris suis]